MFSQFEPPPSLFTWRMEVFKIGFPGKGGGIALKMGDAYIVADDMCYP